MKGGYLIQLSGYNVGTVQSAVINYFVICDLTYQNVAEKSLAFM